MGLKMITTNKDHWCESCHRVIVAGSQHWLNHKPGRYTIHEHKNCSEVEHEPVLTYIEFHQLPQNEYR